MRARQRLTRRRGWPGQRQLRNCERETRKAAVAHSRCALRRGHSPEEAAELLGIQPRTLTRWQRGWRDDRLGARQRGRPVQRVRDDKRREIYAILDELGSSIGVPSLRMLFPEAGKLELAEYVRRYQHATRRGRRQWIQALRWTRPGSVWAMDFTEPHEPIDGIYDQILCVRDLASARLLWALPILGKSSSTVVQSLDALTRWHGAPVVIKLDNDAVFTAAATRDWVARNQIQLLYSPPYTPTYNGAVECGMATLKCYAHIASARNDRPGNWSADDIQQARLRMNEELRPRGARGPTPNELWTERDPITRKERNAFLRTYRGNFKHVCDERELDHEVQCQQAQRASIDRTALSRSLIQLGFLTLKRRRITLPVSKR